MYSDPGIQHAAAQTIRHRTQLRGDGVSPRALAAAVASGALRSVRRGWCAAPEAHPDVVAAVRVGGALTGPSAAALYGLWVPPDARLHVSVARNASRLRTATEVGRSTCIHWRRAPGATFEVVEPLPEVLRQSSGCLTEEMAIVLIDSALNLGVGGLTVRDLRVAFGGAGPGLKYRRVLERCDGRSQSGLETLVRLRLRALGIGVRPQVHHRGVGRVDLLVGERLVIEVDGRKHHDTADGFITDRRRDLVLFGDGYERLRLTYANVMFEWPETERMIVASVRRRRHRWRSGDRPTAPEFRTTAPESRTTAPEFRHERTRATIRPP